MLERKFDRQAVRHETRQERCWLGDLLGHPGARLTNPTLDQDSRHAGGASGGRVRLGLAEERSLSRILAAPDVDAEREPRPLV